MQLRCVFLCAMQLTVLLLYCYLLSQKRIHCQTIWYPRFHGHVSSRHQQIHTPRILRFKPLPEVLSWVSPNLNASEFEFESESVIAELLLLWFGDDRCARLSSTAACRCIMHATKHLINRNELLKDAKKHKWRLSFWGRDEAALGRMEQGTEPFHRHLSPNQTTIKVVVGSSYKS